MNSIKPARYIIPAFYAAAALLVLFYTWTLNIDHQFPLGDYHPLYRNLADCPAYIKYGFESPALPGDIVFEDNWVRFDKHPLKVRNSTLPNLPERSIFSPRRSAAQEFTIIIPIEIGSDGISFLDKNPFVIPGIILSSIGENWEIYFNGTPMLSEMHLNENGTIKSGRYWRYVHFPIERTLITEGTNILALRISGDPNRASTGLRLKNYFYDYSVIKSHYHFFTEMILCGISGYIGFYYLMLFFSIKKRKEQFYLYFSIFSFLLCIYVATRHGIINYIIPDSNTARLMEYLSLMFLIVAFGMFAESIGREKVTKITRAYLVFCFVLAFTQIFIFRHWGEEAISLLNIFIFIYYTYVVFYDCLYFYYRYRKGPGKGAANNTLIGFLIPGAILTYIFGVYEIINMLFFANNFNLQFIYGIFIVQTGMAFAMANRYSAMYNKLEDTLNERNQLLTRIETMLSHTTVVPKSLAKGALSLDIIAGRAFVDNHDMLLTQKEFAVLFLFMQNEGTVINAESIYENVWMQPLNNNINTLRTTISNLRKKIEPSGYEISASRGQGYTFERI